MHETQANSSENHLPRAAAILLPTAILLLTVVVYARTISFEFVFDDRVLVTENNFVQSWQHLPSLFTTYIFSALHPTQHNYYRPIFYLFLLVNHSLFGLDPPGWHAATLALHLIATYLVFLLTLRLSRDLASAAIAGVIFGLHPVHIEGVAWVAAGCEPLAAAFMLGSFLLYLKYRARATEVPSGQSLWLLASLLLYALGALSKEGGVVLPLLIVCYEACVARDAKEPAGHRTLPSMRSVVGSAAPYFIVLVLYLVARYAVLGGLRHSASQMDWGTLLLTLPSVVLSYLRLLFWPVGLSAFYDVSEFGRVEFMSVVVPVIALAVVGGAFVWAARRSAPVAFAVVWLVVTLAPVLDLRVFPNAEILHDRYLYLPSIGFALFMAVVLRDLAAAAARRFGTTIVRVQTAVAVLLALILGGATVGQLGPWKNNFLLYSRGVEAAPNSSVAAHNLALELLKRGQTDRAVELLKGVLVRNPGYWLAAYNLGYIYYQKRDMGEAERHIRHAIQVNPSDAEQVMLLGKILFRAGKFDAAIEAMRHAIELQPRAAGYHLALGAALKTQGQLDAALVELQEELKLHPQQEIARDLIREITEQHQQPPATRSPK